MAIPVEQFPILTPQQAVPALTGAERGVGLARNLMQAAYTPQQMQSQAALKNAMAKMYGAQTQFMPLKYALQAQQQTQTGSRFGGAYQMARALMAAPQPVRAEWIQKNQAAYESVLNTLGQQGLQGPTPSQLMVQKMMQHYFPQYYGAAAQQPQQPQQAPVPQAPSQQGIQQPQQAPVPQAPSQQGIQQPPKPLDAQLDDLSNAFARAKNTPQGQAIEHQTALQQTGQPAQQLAGSVAPSSQELGGLPVPQPSFALGDIQKSRLVTQMTENNALVQGQTRTRAQGAITMERWLGDNQQEYSRRINNALEYAGAKGRGKLYFQEWANKNPHKLADYDWYFTAFMPQVTNNQRIMETMGVTDQQKKELQASLGQARNIASNPTRARIAVNNMFSSWQDLAKSTLKTAQPAHPGVLSKLYGFKFYSGDYIAKPTGAVSGIVTVRSPDGRMWNIPQKNVAEAVRRGGTVIGGR